MNDEILKAFLEEPGGHVVLEIQDDDPVVKQAGPAFARMSFTAPEELVGRRLLDIIAEREGRDSPVAKQILESIQRARDTAEPDKLPPLLVNVRNHGKWEKRWWAITNIPIVEDDRVKYIVQRVEDHTISQAAYAAIRVQRRTSYILYFFVILAVCVGLWRVTQISNEANRTAKQTHQLAKQGAESTAHYRVLRQQELKDVCNKDDQLVKQLRALIIGGATSSKSFEHIYQSLGLPPYAERVRTAEKQAASLRLLNCPALK